MSTRQPFGLQGVAKRVPLSEFPEQAMGQQGVKAISLAVGDTLRAMHACIYSGVSSGPGYESVSAHSFKASNTALPLECNRP